MKLPVYNLKREEVGHIDLADEVFGTEVKEHLFYEVVKAQRASRRAGTRCSKLQPQSAFYNRQSVCDEDRAEQDRCA